MKNESKQTQTNDMRKMFLEEAFDLLTNIENKINLLNQNPEDNIALLDLYRFVHNFKGVSGTAGLNEFESFSHSFENIINLAAKKQIPVDRAVIDLFYDGFDQIDKGVKMLQQNKDPSNIFTDLSRKFDQLRERSGSDEHDQNRARLKELFTQYGLEEFKPESLVFDKKTRNSMMLLSNWTQISNLRPLVCLL